MSGSSMPRLNPLRRLFLDVWGDRPYAGVFPAGKESIEESAIAEFKAHFARLMYSAVLHATRKSFDVRLRHPQAVVGHATGDAVIGLHNVEPAGDGLRRL